MARGRMIDKVIILSKKVNAVSEQAENLYYRLNVCADDFGRHHADAEIIKGQLYTKRKLSLATIQKRLDELWNIGLIEFYVVDGETYLEIVGFADHQTFRKDIPKKAEYPSPKVFLQKSRNGSDTERNGSDTERGLKLSKDKLSKDKLRDMSENSGPLFEKLWISWPQEGRFKKKYCWMKFLALCQQGKHETFDKTTIGYFNVLTHKEKNEGFNQQVMHLSTWLNNWEGDKERYVDKQGNPFRYEPRL